MIYHFASKAQLTKVKECCCTSHQLQREIRLLLWDGTCWGHLLRVTAHQVCPVPGSQVSKKFRTTRTRHDNDQIFTFCSGRQQQWQQRLSWWCYGALELARETAYLSRSDSPRSPAEQRIHSERCTSQTGQHIRRAQITSDTLFYRWLGTTLLQFDLDDILPVSSRQKVALITLPILGPSQKKLPERRKTAFFELVRIHLNDHERICALDVDRRAAIDLRVSSSFYFINFISGRFVFPPLSIDHASLFKRSNRFCSTKEKKEQLQIGKVTHNQHSAILLGARRLFREQSPCSALATLLLHCSDGPNHMMAAAEDNYWPY